MLPPKSEPCFGADSDSRSAQGNGKELRAASWRRFSILQEADVRIGSFSDVGPRAGDVGLTPVSEHRRPDCSGPKSANRVISRCDKIGEIQAGNSASERNGRPST